MLLTFGLLSHSVLTKRVLIKKSVSPERFVVVLQARRGGGGGGGARGVLRNP